MDIPALDRNLNRRTRSVTVTLTPVDYELARASARIEGMPLSTWINRIVKRELREGTGEA